MAKSDFSIFVIYNTKGLPIREIKETPELSEIEAMSKAKELAAKLINLPLWDNYRARGIYKIESDGTVLYLS